MAAPQTLPANFNGWDKPPATLPANFAQWDQSTNSAPAAQPGALDVNYPNTNHWWATASGLQSVGRGLRDAVTGTAQVLDPRAKNDEEQSLVDSDPRARAILPVYRILRSLGHTAQDATQIAGAMHDINNSPDPVGTYAKVAQETAGQGAGQALLGAATEGAIKGAPALVDAAKTAAASETAGKVAASAKVVGGAAEKLPVAGEFVKAAKKLGDLRDIWGAPRAETPPVAPGYERYAPNSGAAPAAQSPTAARVPYGEAQPAPGPEPDLTGANKPFAGGADEYTPPKAKAAPDLTGQNKPFAGGMDEYTAPKPRSIVTDPQTGAPEFSDVVAAKQAQAAPAAETKAPPVATKPAQTETAAAPGPSGDALLDRLKGVADRIQKQEAAAPGSADGDLVQQAQDSLDIVRARKATASTASKPPAETLDQFNQRLGAIADRKAAEAAGKSQQTASSGDLGSVFQRLVKGEAGQAGLPGSVTDADEGISDIQNRPVMGTKTGQVPASGFLKMVGADRNSVLKTPRDLDSVFYHAQQIAKNGPPDVELHVDEGGNVIGAQGRHRAIAAVEQGGPNAKVNVTIYKHPFENSP